MSVMFRWRRMLGLAFVGSTALIAGSLNAQDFDQPRIIQLRAPMSPEDVLVQVGQEPKHWIGVFCRPVDEALRAQLNVPKGQGVVIDGVAPDSPAAKAGLQRHDVLLSLGDKTLGDPTELLKLVDEQGEKEVALELIRQGKKLTVSVTPASRPVPGDGAAFQLPRQNLDTLRMWVERLNDPAHGAIHLRGFGPGVMFGERELPKLPADVSIQINKQGQEPAKIVVTRGDEKWELTDEPAELAKLPDDLRPAVELFLGRAPQPFQVRVPGPNEKFERALPPPDGGAMPVPGDRLEKRLQEVERRLEQLLKEQSGSADSGK